MHRVRIGYASGYGSSDHPVHVVLPSLLSLIIIITTTCLFPSGALDDLGAVLQVAPPSVVHLAGVDNARAEGMLLSIAIINSYV